MKYCNDPDNCTYADCPTAFCDRNKTEETCSICNWTNTSLLNLGAPEKSRWVCHGCCKRAIEALDQIAALPLGHHDQRKIARAVLLAPNTPHQRPPA